MRFVGPSFVSDLVTAISSRKVMVGVEPTPLRAVVDQKCELLIINNSEVTMYFGDEMVTVEDGTPFVPGDGFQAALAEGVQIYAVVESGSADARILEAR